MSALRMKEEFESAKIDIPTLSKISSNVGMEAPSSLFERTTLID